MWKKEKQNSISYGVSIIYLSSPLNNSLTILNTFNCHMKILNLDGQLEILTYQQLLTFLTDVYLTVFANILSEKRIKEAVTEAVTFSQFSTLIFDRVGNSK